MIRSVATRVLALALVVAAVAACTTSGSSTGSSVPVDVTKEIATTSVALDAALVTYASGDTAKADAMVGNAYLEHFEFIEGPLGKVDMAFMERLEDLIRADIRDAMKSGKPVADVEALVNEAKTLLATATTKLE